MTVRPRSSPAVQPAPAPGFRLNRDDMIDFVDPVSDPGPASKVRRFGDNPSHAPLFAALAQKIAGLIETRGFVTEFDAELLGVVGRPSLLQPARRVSARLGGGQIFLKREDLFGEDRHLLLSVAGQGLVARRLGCTTLVTGTRDGRRGVVMAHVAARLGLKAVVYMDRKDIERHSSNAFRLKLQGAQLNVVDSQNLRNADIREAALNAWARQPGETFLVTGLDAAPLPYPTLLRTATTSIGRECRRQVHAATGALPAVVIARNGETADALGVFPAFLDEEAVKLLCVEIGAPPPSARTGGSLDSFDPSQQPLSSGEMRTARAIQEGLEYPSVRREHEWLKSSGRVVYVKAGLVEARRAITEFSEMEGFIPPFETAHVLAWACKMAQGLKPEQSVLAVVAEQANQDIWDIGRLMGVAL